ncbi:MAG TPA: hypothetical protein PLO40_12940 [Spirochaetota bacterium]|nr:hypothetical protein [Spirochaetota bacterium]
MPMTDEEKSKVIKMLDKLDDSSREKAISSFDSFVKWLSNALYNIYCKIKDALKSLWETICNIFK